MPTLEEILTAMEDLYFGWFAIGVTAVIVALAALRYSQ